MKRTSLRWLQAAACILLIACAGEPSSPQLTPQYSRGDNHGVGPGREYESFPALDAIALYAAPSSQSNAFSLIGPAGGSARLGDFEIVVPPGAVDRPIVFHIVLPADPKERTYAVAEFGPHVNFNVPITIRLPGQATNLVGAPSILWWDRNGQGWVAVEGGTTVLGDGRLEAHPRHLSFWGTWSGTTQKGILTSGG